MMNNIQKVQKEDLNDILELQKLCYQEAAERYDDYDIPPLTQTLEEIEKEYESNLILKIEDNNKIIASIRAYQDDRTCYIGRLIVHPDYQNRGIGQALMDHIEQFFPNVDRFELFTGFKDDKNIYLYKKLGYVIFKEEKISDNVAFVFMEKGN